ncbi:MAG: dockerin type I domain-containing protein [Oscillospiraceae bacterium]|nr:dockerin type I domain-containing protein [Oscillospiraceae bacterium]
MNIKRKTLAVLTALSLAATTFTPLAAFAADDTDLAEDVLIEETLDEAEVLDAEEEIVEETEVETLDAETESVELTDADTDTTWYTENTSAMEYTISTAAELRGLASLVNNDAVTTTENPGIFYGKTIYLGDDITIDSDWTSIGYLSGSDTTTARAFTGTFDGNGNKITLSGSNGLFGLIAYATIENLTLDVDINNTDDITGSPSGNGVAALAVCAVYQADIKNVTIDGSVIANYSDTDGYADAAAFINRAGKGLTATINITDCVNNAKVVAYDRKAAGYIVSMNGGATVNITNCENNGRIEAYQLSTSSGEMYSAGFTAWNSGVLNMTNCTNNGEIYGYRTVDGSSTLAVGGISANAWQSTCTATYTNVTNNGELMAINDAYQAYAWNSDGSVKSIGHNVHVGGIVGMANPSATVYITDATSAGKINGSITNESNTNHYVNAGGIIGQLNSATVHIYSAVVENTCTITTENPNTSADNVGVYVGNRSNGSLYLYSVENNSNITVTGNGDNATASYVASVTTGGTTTYYETIAEAIAAVPTDGTETTITLLQDMAIEETVEISSDKNVILDLAGHTISATGCHAITNSGILTINDSSEDATGTVDALSHAKATIYNNGTVILNGGTYKRSNEAGASTTDNGSNSYYTILNHGTMTVNDGVTVLNSGKYSSLFENGYQNYNSGNSGSGYVEGTNSANPTLTINGGIFDGGLNTIKNDDGSILEINGGTFTNVAQNVVLNVNVATINGGDFTTNANYAVIQNRYKNDVYITGQLTITGGTFTNTNSGSDATVISALNTTGNTDTVKITITGGTFTNNSSSAAAINAGNTATAISDGTFTNAAEGDSVAGDNLSLTGGTYSDDVSEYVADNYYAYDETTGTYKVLASSSKVYESASTSSYSVTLTDLWDEVSSDSDFSYNENAEYRVVLSDIDTTDTAVSTAVSTIKADNTGSEFIETDISVKKYVNNVVDDSYTYTPTNAQTVQITLPVPAESGTVKVYHIDSTKTGGYEEINSPTLSDDGYTVTFETSSFSPYVFVYTPRATITYEDNVYLSLDDGDVKNDGVYNLVLNGVTSGNADAVIYRFMSAQLKLALDDSCDIKKINALSIAPADGINVIYNGNGEYGFYADATNANSSITAKTITLGTVTVSGVGTYEIDLSTENGFVNQAHGAETTNNIVTDFVYNANYSTGTGYLLLDGTFPTAGSVTLLTTELKVNVMFPNEVKNNEAAYTNMSVNIKGGVGIDETIKLGSDTTDVAYTTIDGYYGYTYTFTVPMNYTYALTFTGDGYRTCTTTITPSDTTSSVTVWNNVMSDDTTVVTGGTGTGDLKVTFLAGDIVMDNEINLYDLSAVVSYFGKTVTATEQEFICYDLNRDGKIDSKDIAMVLVSWNK